MAMSELTLEDLDTNDVFSDDVVPASTRLHLARQQLQIWQNTAYDARLRYRVSKGLGAKTEDLEAVRAQYTQALQAIELLKAEVFELE